MSTDYGRSVPELFTDLINQLSTLFRKEVQLARAEMGEKVSHATGALPTLLGGGALLFGALIILLQAAAALLVYFGIRPGWALLIVGVLAALVGWLLVRGGINRLKTSNLIPERTAEQLSRDAAVAKEQVR